MRSRYKDFLKREQKGQYKYHIIDTLEQYSEMSELKSGMNFSVRNVQVLDFKPHIMRTTVNSEMLHSIVGGHFANTKKNVHIYINTTCICQFTRFLYL